MALTNVELYEALKGSIPEEAARMIAEVVPPARDLATKLDIAEVKREVTELRAEMHLSATRTIQWILGVTVPLFVGTWGSVVAVLLKG
ncbi:MAG TPA: hypothetical protein VFA34_16400 [Actinomycetota bacterium]|jgi:hypothetical protein|nr:hypothetical protein [Actinomycetota bacterium]